MNSPRLDLSKEPPVLGVGTMKILFAGFVGGAMRVSENGNLLVITLYDRSDNQKRTGTASKNHPTRVVTHE